MKCWAEDSGLSPRRSLPLSLSVDYLFIYHKCMTLMLLETTRAQQVNKMI